MEKKRLEIKEVLVLKYREEDGIGGVKKILSEMSGLVIEYKQKEKEFYILSDGYRSVRVRVQDGDFLVKIPAAENGLKRDAFFVLNPAIALECLFEAKEVKKRVKKSEKKEKEEKSEDGLELTRTARGSGTAGLKKGGMMEFIKETVAEINSPEYQEAMSELRRAQARLNRPFMESAV